MRKWLIGVGLAAATLVGAYAAVDHFANRQVAIEAERFAERLRRDAREVRYARARMDTLAQRIVIEDVRVVTRAGETVTIERVEIGRFEWAIGRPPRWAELSLFGLDAPLDRAPDFVRAVFGPRWKGDTRLRYRYDPEARSFEIVESVMDSPTLGRLTAAFRLGNVADFDGMARRPGDAIALLAAMPAMTFERAEIVYADRGLVARIVKAYATPQGLTDDEARRRLADFLRQEAARARNALERELAEALAAMVERPGTLSVVAEPAAPVPAFRLMTLMLSGRPDGGALKSLFGIRVAKR
jgi:hypothetical protein